MVGIASMKGGRHITGEIVLTLNICGWRSWPI
jgi:hypothetical protein